MAHMNIFDEDAFSMVELTAAMEDLPFNPSLIRSLGLYEFRGIRQRLFSIERRGGVLELIPFTPDGADPTPTDRRGEARSMRVFSTEHVHKENRISASEVAGIRAFGTETELQQVMNEVAGRMQRLRNELEYTYEFHMLNGLDGLVKDPKTGSTIYDFYDEFGIARPGIFDMDLDNAAAPAGALKRKCQEIRDSFEDAMEGTVGTIRVAAVCGRNFWNDLTVHKDVIEAYKAAAALAELRELESDDFFWGDIHWRRYRGTGAVSVPTNECRFYVEGVPGLFQQYASPVEDMEFVNTPGLEAYYRIIVDRDRNKWAQPEVEANPMFVCTRPKALRRGKRT